MAYIPTEWETGDVITAEKLNNMEQGIEDAFVAPAVTISDEGDVLTVNSSGEWEKAPLPDNAIIFEGVVSSDNGTAFTFTLTSGDVSDLAFAENIYIKADLVIATQKVAELIIPLRSIGFSGGVANGYNFMSVMSMSTGVYHARITYSISQEEWVAALTKLD